jgi:hypothetical protein
MQAVVVYSMEGMGLEWAMLQGDISNTGYWKELPTDQGKLGEGGALTPTLHLLLLPLSQFQSR